ncbi:MAG: alpha/beta hydrolase [Myxococcales bacterium]
MLQFMTRLVTIESESVPAGDDDRLGAPNTSRSVAARTRMTTAVGCALLLAAGCAPASSTNPGPDSSSTGGNPGTGGARIATGSGGAGMMSGGTGGAMSATVTTGGASGSGGVEGGSGGTSPSPDAGVGVVGSGGRSSNGGSPGGTAGRGGNVAGGSGGNLGGSGGNTMPLTPPVRDAASKQPVSRAPAGYQVEGNFAYGPLATHRLDVLYPDDAGPKGTRTLPAVLIFHGGGWTHNFENGNGKNTVSGFSDRFLAHGFLVFTADYRVANKSSPEAGFAPEAVKDVLLAAKWCWDYLDYFHGDKSRYVVSGDSAGGHLAMMVGMITPAAALGPTSPTDYKIAAIVDNFGPANIEEELGAVANAWVPASLPNRAAIAKLVNPMTYVRMNTPPMIAVQGALDSTAPIAHTRDLVARMKAAGADVAMHEVAGAGHGFYSPASAWPDAEKATFDWLVAHDIGK